MGTKPPSAKKVITVKQVGLAAAVFGVLGGIYGYFNGGPYNVVILFAECFISGFVVFYICASFIALLRK